MARVCSVTVKCSERWFWWQYRQDTDTVNTLDDEGFKLQKRMWCTEMVFRVCARRNQMTEENGQMMELSQTKECEYR